jgi:hypothetical protein
MFEKQLPAWQDRNDLWKAERERILRNTKLTEPQKAAALAAMSPQPVRPLDPVLTSADPTIEGLVRFFARGQPAIGLFTDEGGQFIGSHAMNTENRLRTATAYSEFWDGSVFTRIRASEETLILCGRRVSAHLMAQPDVAAMMLADPLLANQGLLSRILLSAPDSIVGTRLWHESAPESDRDISTYTSHLLTLLEDPPTMRPGKINELFPRELILSPAARAQWIRFADEVERQMVAGGGYESIRGLPISSPNTLPGSPVSSPWSSGRRPRSSQPGIWKPESSLLATTRSRPCVCMASWPMTSSCSWPDGSWNGSEAGSRIESASPTSTSEARVPSVVPNEPGR